MPDMQISVGLRRKSRTHLCIDSLLQILIYLLFNKIFRNCLFSHISPP